MAEANNQTYLDIGYNDLLQTGASLSFTLGENVQPDGSSNGVSSNGSSSAGSNGVTTTGGSVETKAVKTEGSLDNLWIKTFIKSTNWSPKKVGFYLNGEKGYAEFLDVYISGNITAISGTIGGFTIDATSLSITSGGNTVILSSGVTAFTAGPTGAPTITMTQAGVATFKNVVLQTSVQISGIVAGSELAIQDWVHTLTFSVTDADTVAWTSGTLTFLDGTTFAIDAGNTGNMSAETYIYFDRATSETVLQTTTDKSDSVGINKVLICVAQNGTDEASFVDFDSKNLNIPGTSIVAGSITGNEIAANTITANKISVSSLSAISANIGAITAGTITLDTAGYIRGGQTDYNTGTGFFLGYSGGAYKFSIGSTTQFLTWDGSVLNIGGKISHLAGTVLYKSADTTRSSNNSSYHLTKGITVYRPGTYRIKFTISSSDASNNAYGRIYRNGVAVGTERQTAGTTEFSEDISSWSAGDEIQVWTKWTGDGAQNTSISNFRLYVLDFDSSTVTTDVN